MALQPILMDNVDLIIGDVATGTNFKCQLTSVKLTPDVPQTKLRTLCPTGTYNRVGSPSWALEVGYANFYDDGTGTAGVALADFLLENNGEQFPFTFRPIAGGAGYSGTLTAVAGGFGGDKDAYAENSVSLPVDGQPVKVAAA